MTLKQRKHSFQGALPGIPQDRGQVATVAASKIEQALHDAEAAVLQKLRPALPRIGANGSNGGNRSQGRTSIDGNALRSWDTKGTAPTKLHGVLANERDRTIHESPLGDEPLHPEEKRAPRKISRAAIEQFLERRRSSSQISAAPSSQKSNRGISTVAGNSNEITLRHTPTDTASNRSNYIRARAQRARRAATLIQAAWRGHVLRRELAFQAHMITRIQALFRGYSTRQMLKKAKKKPRRPKLGWWADCVQAIVLIQTTYRRHMARKLVDLHRHEHADLAAQIIQQGWARHLARKAWLADTTAVVEVPYMIQPNALAAAAYVHGTRVLSVKIHHAMETGDQEIHILCGSNISARRTEMMLNSMIGEKLEQMEAAKRPRQSFFGGMFSALKGSPGGRRASKRASKIGGQQPQAQASQQPYPDTPQSYDDDEPGVTVTRGIPRGTARRQPEPPLQPRQPDNEAKTWLDVGTATAVRTATANDILNLLGTAEGPAPIAEEPESIAEDPELAAPDVLSPSLIEGIGSMLARVAVASPQDTAGAARATTVAQEANAKAAEAAAANAATETAAAKSQVKIDSAAEAKAAEAEAARFREAVQQEYDAAKNAMATKTKLVEIDAAAEAKAAEAKAARFRESVQRDYDAAKDDKVLPAIGAAKAVAEAEAKITAANTTVAVHAAGSSQAGPRAKIMVPPLKVCVRVHEIGCSSPASAHLRTNMVSMLAHECAEAEDATRKQKTGLMELVLFQSDADQDKFFVMTAFNSAADEGAKEVALIDLTTRAVTSKTSTDFEVLVENGDPSAADVRLLPRSKYFTGADCVALLVDLSCPPDADVQIEDTVTETLLQFRRICVQRDTVIQCMVLQRVTEISRQYRLVVVYEDSAAAEEHTGSVDALTASLSLVTLARSTTMLSRPARASEPALFEAAPASEAVSSKVVLESACPDDRNGLSAPRLPRMSTTEVDGTVSGISTNDVSDLLDVFPIEANDVKTHATAAESSDTAAMPMAPDAAPTGAAEMIGHEAQAEDIREKSARLVRSAVKTIKHVGNGIKAMTRTSDFEFIFAASIADLDNTPTMEQIAGSPEPPPISFSSSNTAKRKASGLPVETLLKRSKSAGIQKDDARTRRLTPEFLARTRGLKGQVHPFPDDCKIEFMTDIEGNLQYLQTLVANSDVLFWDGDESLDLAENAYVVHGGDTVDKGPGDIRVLRLLMDLKIKYPERVFLIIGNRDTNKVRFMSELEEKYWGSNKVPFLERHTPYSQFIEEKGLDHGEAAALKWMLHESMGCRQTFELRRKELSELQRIPVTIISDAVVLKSFKDMIDPKADNPLYLQHLQLGQMMVQIGDCLFTHGGIHAAGIGYVPRKPTCLNLADWVRTLNGWMDEELDNFVANPYFTEDGHRSCEDMIEYTAPWFEGSEFDGMSMIYSDGFVGTDGFAPRYPDPEVIDLLEEAGVTRVLVGHRPQGDTPTTLRCPSGLLVIVADTSFSDPDADKGYNPSNFRGAVFSTVKVTKTDVTVDGVTAKNGFHGFRVNKKHIGDEPIPDHLVGRQLEDETWVKTVLKTGEAYCAGWVGWTCTAAPRDIEDILSSNPHLPLSSTMPTEVLAAMAAAGDVAAEDSPSMPGLKPKFEFPDSAVDPAAAELAAPAAAVETTHELELASQTIAQVDGAAMDEGEDEPQSQPDVAAVFGAPEARSADPVAANDVKAELTPAPAYEVPLKPNAADAAAMSEDRDEHASVAVPVTTDDIAAELTPAPADEVPAEPVSVPKDIDDSAMDDPAPEAEAEPAATGDAAAELTPDPAAETPDEPEEAVPALTDDTPAPAKADRQDDLNDSILGPADPEEEREFLEAEALAAAEVDEQSEQGSS